MRPDFIYNSKAYFITINGDNNVAGYHTVLFYEDYDRLEEIPVIEYPPKPIFKLSKVVTDNILGWDIALELNTIYVAIHNYDIICFVKEHIIKDGYQKNYTENNFNIIDEL